MEIQPSGFDYRSPEAIDEVSKDIYVDSEGGIHLSLTEAITLSESADGILDKYLYFAVRDLSIGVLTLKCELQSQIKYCFRDVNGPLERIHRMTQRDAENPEAVHLGPEHSPALIRLYEYIKRQHLDDLTNPKVLLGGPTDEENDQDHLSSYLNIIIHDELAQQMLIESLDEETRNSLIRTL